MAEVTPHDGGGYGCPDEALFVPGVDYVSGWRVADEAAREVNAALEELGVDARLVRAVPHSGARGEPVVWLRPEDARLIARALRRV